MWDEWGDEWDSWDKDDDYWDMDKDDWEDDWDKEWDDWEDWIIGGDDMDDWEFWEDPDWWIETMEELANMTFEALYDLVCTDTKGMQEMEDACADAEVSHEELLRTIRGLSHDEVK